MIPPLDEHGLLPPGIHPATLDEIEARFGAATEIRRAQMQSVRWLVDLANHDDVIRIVINGSFVTDAPEPNDVDGVLLVGPTFASDPELRQRWEDGLPFIHVQIEGIAGFEQIVRELYAKGRYDQPKGMIEVIP